MDVTKALLQPLQCGIMLQEQTLTQVVAVIKGTISLPAVMELLIFLASQASFKAGLTWLIHASGCCAER